MVCVNKYDLNVLKTNEIITYANENKLRVVDSIPFDPLITRAMIRAQTIPEYDPNAQVSHAVRRTWDVISEHMKL